MRSSFAAAVGHHKAGRGDTAVGRLATVEEVSQCIHHDVWHCEDVTSFDGYRRKPPAPFLLRKPLRYEVSRNFGPSAVAHGRSARCLHHAI